MSERDSTGRQQLNKLGGLSAFAGALVLSGLIAYMCFDEIQTGGFEKFVAGIKQDPTPALIGLAAVGILCGVGYSGTVRPKSPGKDG